MMDVNALNLYQISIYENLILLYQANTGIVPSIFFKKLLKINHNYHTSSNSYRNYAVNNEMNKFSYIKEMSKLLEYSFRYKTNFYNFSKQKSKTHFSHVTTSFCSFNDFKFDDLSKYTFLFKCNDQQHPIIHWGAWWYYISVFCTSLALQAVLSNCLVNLYYSFLLPRYVCIFMLTSNLYFLHYCKINFKKTYMKKIVLLFLKSHWITQCFAIIQNEWALENWNILI